MEIKITGQRLASARIDMTIFRREFKKTFNLDKAIETSVACLIETQGKLEDKHVKDALKLCVNWTHFFLHDEFNTVDEINFKFINAQYKDWLRYRPGKRINNRTFVLNEQKDCGQDVIVLNDFLNNDSTMIKDFIAIGQFRFGFDNWEYVFDYEKL